MPLPEDALQARDALAREVLTSHEELSASTTFPRSVNRDSRLRGGIASWPYLSGDPYALYAPTWLAPLIGLARLARESLRERGDIVVPPSLPERLRLSNHPWIGQKLITGVGVRQTGGLLGRASELIVFGTHPEALAQVSRTYAGLRVRKQLGGAFIAASQPRWPVGGGASIGHEADATRFGTLGCRVTDAAGRPFLVTAGHVLANAGQWQDGDGVVQPARSDGGGAAPDDLLARLDRLTPLLLDGQENVVDAARARILESHVDRVAATVGQIGPIQGSRDILLLPTGGTGLRVQKCGRSTGHTVGTVLASDFQGNILHRPSSVVTFTHQLLVEGLDAKPFAAQGDSGAMVLDEQGQTVGLLHAVDELSGIAVVTPIRPVLEALDVIL